MGDSDPSHISPALAIVVTSDVIHVLKAFRPFSVHQAMRFSPAILADSSFKSLFILYQLLHGTREVHAKGISLGDISLHDIHISKEYFVSLSPSVHANLISMSFDTNEEEFEPQRSMSDDALDLLKSLKQVMRECKDLSLIHI